MYLTLLNPSTASSSSVFSTSFSSASKTTSSTTSNTTASLFSTSPRDLEPLICRLQSHFALPLSPPISLPHPLSHSLPVPCTTTTINSDSTTTSSVRDYIEKGLHHVTLATTPSSSASTSSSSTPHLSTLPLSSSSSTLHSSSSSSPSHCPVTANRKNHVRSLSVSTVSPVNIHCITATIPLTHKAQVRTSFCSF